jgi:hypothetical protein
MGLCIEIDFRFKREFMVGASKRLRAQVRRVDV